MLYLKCESTQTMGLLQEEGILLLLGICPRKYGLLIIILPSVQPPDKTSHLLLGACFDTDVYYAVSRSFCVL